ncbi:MAG: FAD-dependent oxidoreductase [Promethearchaeota archaeon]
MIDEVETDLVVVGGGLAGCFAAVAARRTDPSLRVWLVERYGFLGGMATAGYVFPFMRYFTRIPGTGETKRLVGGLFQETLEEMHARGYTEASAREAGFYTRFDPMMLRCVLDELVVGAGVNLLFHGLVNAVGVAGTIGEAGGGARGGTGDAARLESCTVQTKAGPVEFRARAFVDATGDADLVFHAGGDFEMGRAGDGLVQPATLNFRMGNVGVGGEEDPGALDDEVVETWVLPYERATIGRLVREEKARGNPLTPRDDCLSFVGIHTSERHFNQTRVAGFDFTDPFDLTEAEVEGRRQVERFVQLLRERVPEYAGATVASIGTQIGVRESRRVVGEYKLTSGDLFAGTTFPDRVALGCYPIDIHDPAGSSRTEIVQFPPGHFYSIPFRVMLPHSLENLVVAGRPVSATHEAHSAIRVMPTCSALGHAAGVASALALSSGSRPSFKAVNVDALQATLRRQGAVLD